MRKADKQRLDPLEVLELIDYYSTRSVREETRDW